MGFYENGWRKGPDDLENPYLCPVCGGIFWPRLDPPRDLDQRGTYCHHEDDQDMLGSDPRQWPFRVRELAGSARARGKTVPSSVPDSATFFADSVRVVRQVVTDGEEAGWLGVGPVTSTTVEYVGGRWEWWVTDGRGDSEKMSEQVVR
jgi:hypothetical protein